MPYEKVSVLDPSHDSASTQFLAINKAALINVNQPITIYGVGVKIGVITDANAATCVVTKRVLIGSDANAVAIDTLYIPVAAAAGKIIYVEITPMNANAGDQLKFVFSNHGGSGTWLPWVDAVVRPETKANNSHFQLNVDV